MFFVPGLILSVNSLQKSQLNFNPDIFSKTGTHSSSVTQDIPWIHKLLCRLFNTLPTVSLDLYGVKSGRLFLSTGWEQ
jgi:hypothetical protein